MAHTFTSVLLHTIFSTKNRQALLSAELRPRLFAYMGGIVRDLKSTALIINGVDDHVHLLVSLHPTIALSDFMKELKAVSSGWAKSTLGMGDAFGWQVGYAAFSVSRSLREDVQQYIEVQEEHHRRVSFQEEYLAFLKKHEIAFDPRFVFEQELVG